MTISAGQLADANDFMHVMNKTGLLLTGTYANAPTSPSAGTFYFAVDSAQLLASITGSGFSSIAPIVIAAGTTGTQYRMTATAGVGGDFMSAQLGSGIWHVNAGVTYVASNWTRCYISLIGNGVPLVSMMPFNTGASVSGTVSMSTIASATSSAWFVVHGYSIDQAVTVLVTLTGGGGSAYSASYINAIKIG